MLSSVIISIVYLPRTLFLPFLTDLDEIMDLWRRALIRDEFLCIQCSGRPPF